MKIKTESQKLPSCNINESSIGSVSRYRERLAQLVFVLASVGAVLTATHGAFYPTDHTLSSGEFSAKVHSDLHPHSDNGTPGDKIVADSRSLRMLKGIMRSTS